jgi:hypothetical protein
MPDQFSLTLLREFGAYRDRQPLWLLRPLGAESLLVVDSKDSP